MKASKLKKAQEEAIARQQERKPLMLPKQKYVAPYYEKQPITTAIKKVIEHTQEPSGFYTSPLVKTGKENVVGRNHNM